MVEKVKLEKLFVQEARNTQAESTFNKGQSSLRNIVNKFSRASSRKNSSLNKRKEYQTQHCSVVKEKMEQAQNAETDRVISAIERTGHKTYDFLQRLEQQVKDRDEEH